jgi:hypothetical protein
VEQLDLEVVELVKLDKEVLALVQMEQLIQVVELVVEVMLQDVLLVEQVALV